MARINFCPAEPATALSKACLRLVQKRSILGFRLARVTHAASVEVRQRCFGEALPAIDKRGRFGVRVGLVKIWAPC